MSQKSQSGPPVAENDEQIGSDPDAVIEFGQDVEEGFVGLVEHQLAMSDFVRTERVPLTARGDQMTILVTEVRHNE